MPWACARRRSRARGSTTGSCSATLFGAWRRCTCAVSPCKYQGTLNMPRPFVSVLIDTYNHERFIEQAIVTALEQDFPASEREILVVDDGSTDNTPALVEKFRPHVRYLRKANGGQASAFNVGIPEARGEIIAFLDGDDWWARGKVSTVIAHLVDNPDVGTVGHGLYEVHSGSDALRVVAPDRDYRLDLGE